MRILPLLFLLAAAPAAAQSPLLRGSDKHTAVPESVMGDRKAWGADLAFGGSFFRGNATVNYLNTGFDLFKAWSKNSVYLQGNMVYNTSGDLRILNYGSLTTRWDHGLTGPWKLFAFHTDGYNDFTRLNYRGTTGAGPWYDFAWGPTKNGVSLALTHEYERYRFGEVRRSGRFSLREVAKLPLSPVAELSADVFWCPKIDQINDDHLYINLSLNTLIWKGVLGLRVSWIDEYNSRPQPGVKTNDVLWLTSLTVHMGK